MNLSLDWQDITDDESFGLHHTLYSSTCHAHCSIYVSTGLVTDELLCLLHAVTSMLSPTPSTTSSTIPRVSPTIPLYQWTPYPTPWPELVARNDHLRARTLKGEQSRSGHTFPVLKWTGGRHDDPRISRPLKRIRSTLPAHLPVSQN